MGCFNSQFRVTISNNFWLELSISNLRGLSQGNVRYSIDNDWKQIWLTLEFFLNVFYAGEGYKLIATIGHGVRGNSTTCKTSNMEAEACVYSHQKST